MTKRTQEDVDLLRDAAREVRERTAPKKGGRYTEHAYPGGVLRYKAPKPELYDGLSTRPGPGPRGPTMAELQDQVRRRRREEAGRGGGR